MSTMLFGYDVEVCDPAEAEVTRQFLRIADRIHKETGAPCTLFVCGRTLENSPDAFRELQQDARYDFQSHMYAHSLIRPDVQWHEGRHVGDPHLGRVSITRAASLEQVRAELARTKELLAEILGTQNLGLRAPTGSYMGLLDRPEVLDILWELGMRYVSSYHLHVQDFRHWKLAPVEPQDIIQPFWYGRVNQQRGYHLADGESDLPSHLPDILEFPLLGAAIDCVWKDVYGYDAYDEYLKAVKLMIDVIARQNLVLTYVQHDRSSIRGDPTMAYTRAIIEYAQEKGVQLTTHTAYYRLLRTNRSP